MIWKRFAYDLYIILKNLLKYWFKNNGMNLIIIKITKQEY
jgi:hypothetical protein